MIQDLGYQFFSQSFSSSVFIYKYIGQESEGGKISDDPRESYLPFWFEETKAKRVIYGFLHCMLGDSFRPVRLRQEVVYIIDI